MPTQIKEYQKSIKKKQQHRRIVMKKVYVRKKTNKYPIRTSTVIIVVYQYL